MKPIRMICNLHTLLLYMDWNMRPFFLSFFFSFFLHFLLEVMLFFYQNFMHVLLFDYKIILTQHWVSTYSYSPVNKLTKKWEHIGDICNSEREQSQWLQACNAISMRLQPFSQKKKNNTSPCFMTSILLVYVVVVGRVRDIDTSMYLCCTWTWTWGKGRGRG